MSNRTLALVFVIAYVVILLITAPAQLLIKRIALPPEIRLGPVDGSLWRGSSRWLEFNGIRSGAVQWRVSPWGLFSGTPLHLSVQEPINGEAGIGAADDGLRLSNVTVTSSLGKVLDMAGYSGLGIEARVELDIDTLIWSAGGCSSDAGGAVMLSDWSGDLPGLNTIGEQKAGLSCEDGRLVITVDPDNAIALSGRVVVAGDGPYQVDLQAAPPQGELFDAFAQLFGRPRDGRRFVLSHRG